MIFSVWLTQLYVLNGNKAASGARDQCPGKTPRGTYHDQWVETKALLLSQLPTWERKVFTLRSILPGIFRRQIWFKFSFERVVCPRSLDYEARKLMNHDRVGGDFCWVTPLENSFSHLENVSWKKDTNICGHIDEGSVIGKFLKERVDSILRHLTLDSRAKPELVLLLWVTGT